MKSKLERTRRWWQVALLVGLVLTVAGPKNADSRPPSKRAKFVVIVHPSNSHPIDAGLVREIFFKRSEFWPDGTRVEPLDLGAGSNTRSIFSFAILDRPTSAVRGYWNQRLFSGVAVPPPEYESEREVVAYVAEHRGAIGYVSTATKLYGVRAVDLGRE